MLASDNLVSMSDRNCPELGQPYCPAVFSQTRRRLRYFAEASFNLRGKKNRSHDASCLMLMSLECAHVWVGVGVWVWVWVWVCVCVCARAQCVCASGVPVALGPMTYKFRNTSLYLKGSGIVPIPVLSIFLAVCSILELEAAISTAFATFRTSGFPWYLQHVCAICSILVVFATCWCSNQARTVRVTW